MSVAAAVADAGAESFTALPLRLDPGVKEHYFNWLRVEYPHLLRRYERSFDSRHLSVDYQKRIEAISNLARDRFSLGERRYRGTMETPRPKPVLQLALV